MGRKSGRGRRSERSDRRRILRTPRDRRRGLRLSSRDQQVVEPQEEEYKQLSLLGMESESKKMSTDHVPSYVF